MSLDTTEDVVHALRSVRRRKRLNAPTVSQRMQRCDAYVQALESRVLNHGRDITVSVLLDYVHAVGARLVIDDVEEVARG